MKLTFLYVAVYEGLDGGGWGVGVGVYAPSPSMFELRKKKLYCEVVNGMGVVGVGLRGGVVGLDVYAPSPSPCSN